MTRLQRRNLVVVAGLGSVLVTMTTLVSYSVPLYRLFCAATGYAGTTRRVVADTAQPSRQMVTIRFDTQVANHLQWRFEPVQNEIKVHLGEEKLVFFDAENLTNHAIVGHATFNVTPVKAAIYFNKIQCFCFSDERLGAGENARMPVDFFVDPAMARDADAADVDTITLSYTFFPAAAPKDAEDLARFDPNAAPSAERGARLFAERCSVCHALNRNGVGPMLRGVVGRRAATVEGYSYSLGLRDSGLVWSGAALNRWLADPRRLVSGTKMPIRVLDENARRDLIAYLTQQSRGAALAGTP